LASLLLGSLALVSARLHTQSTVPTEQEFESAFASFIKQHNKQYTADEFFHRFNVFKSNMEFIRTHNVYSGADYTMGPNAFLDLTWAEFRQAKLGFKNVDNSVLRENNVEILEEVDVQAGAAVDWRSKGIVTPVKDQGQCGSCWAFSTTGSTEGAYAQKTGKLISLSEQQLVDCSTTQGNQGCNGGLMDYGFQYIITNRGITTEAAYPYKGVDGTCKKSQTAAATISSFKDVAAGSETQLLTVATKQPVSVAIEADQMGFQFYSGGVFTATCGKNLDHGVLVVGYGTDAGKDYWIVKNSWGSSWGEAGYIRMIRNKNQCGIAQQASYPVA